MHPIRNLLKVNFKKNFLSKCSYSLETQGFYSEKNPLTKKAAILTQYLLENLETTNFFALGRARFCSHGR